MVADRDVAVMAAGQRVPQRWPERRGMAGELVSELTGEAVTTSEDLIFRQAEPEDLSSAIEVCSAALGWADGGIDADFFRWKHLQNPFGPSSVWLAEQRGEPDRQAEIVGVRAMMRWELSHPTEGTRHMSRAVDTATLPSHQGRGIFTKLTMAAVDSLTEAGGSAVFNTPNDKSRPGYLKMGWETLGRVPVALRPRSVASLAAVLRARIAAEKWGEPVSAGLEPSEALADDDAVAAALASAARPRGWSTPLSADYLRWRTGFEALRCRVALVGPSVAEGFVVFRVRRRGPMRQLSVLHVVAPDDAGPRRLLGSLMAETRADVALTSGDSMRPGLLMAPLPRNGPLLTWRPLAEQRVPELDDLTLDLGTIELF